MSNKNKMYDMIPNEKRSIRRVPLGNSRSREERREETPEESHQETEEMQVQPPRPPRPPHPRAMRRGSSKWWKFGIAAVVLLIVFVVVMNIFSGATVAVTPQQQDVTIEGTFVASTVADVDTLAYEMFSVTKEAQKEVAASGSETVQTKASGTIIVFNDFSDAPQILVENTRFRTPSGLVYRIQDQITVPGQLTDVSGETVPGSIEVRVVADQPGEEYNIDLSDFDIPGFEESGDLERFDKFFARSKTPMTGGFDGTRKILNEADALEARAELDTKLEGILKTALENELPDGFVVYNAGTFYSYRDLSQKPVEGQDKATLVRSGTLHAIAFNSADLARFVGFSTVAAYDGAAVELEDPFALTFDLVDKDAFDPTAPGEFEFTLSGKDTLVWQFDEERLRNDLVGKSKDDIQMVLSAYPAIQKADITLNPFWRRSFPEKVEDIKVKYEAVQ